MESYIRNAVINSTEPYSGLLFCRQRVSYRGHDAPMRAPPEGRPRCGSSVRDILRFTEGRKSPRSSADIAFGARPGKFSGPSIDRSVLERAVRAPARSLARDLARRRKTVLRASAFLLHNNRTSPPAVFHDVSIFDEGFKGTPRECRLPGQAVRDAVGAFARDFGSGTRTR